MIKKMREKKLERQKSSLFQNGKSLEMLTKKVDLCKNILKINNQMT